MRRGWIGAIAVLGVVASGAFAAPLGSGVVYARADHYPSAVALYVAANTIYAANNGTNDITVTNGATCSALNTSSCGRKPARQDVGVVPTALGVDQSTQTVYVVNNTTTAHGSVSVVDATLCNATYTRGCTHFPHLPPVVHLPFEPNDIAINERTHTVYVDGANKQLAVIDTRRCNGGDTSGCRHAAFIAHVPAGAGGVAVNPATNTVYVVDYFKRTVSVIDGRSCNGANTTGCKRKPATLIVGLHPWRLTVDAATNTVYVTNFGANSVSVINGATCNGRTSRGCRSHPPYVRVGHEPEGVAVDGARHLAFVTNAASNSVSVFDTTRCRGSNTSGCNQRPASIHVGQLPDGIAINPATATVYVADNRGSTLAVFSANR